MARHGWDRGKLLSVYHNSGTAADAINYAGRTDNAANLQTKESVEALIGDSIKDIEDSIEDLENGGGGAKALDDLSDVDTSTNPPTDGQALVWDNGSKEWKPGTVSSGEVEGRMVTHNGTEQGYFRI